MVSDSSQLNNERPQLMSDPKCFEGRRNSTGQDSTPDPSVILSMSIDILLHEGLQTRTGAVNEQIARHPVCLPRKQIPKPNILNVCKMDLG